MSCRAKSQFKSQTRNINSGYPADRKKLVELRSNGIIVLLPAPVGAQIHKRFDTKCITQSVKKAFLLGSSMYLVSGSSQRSNHLGIFLVPVTFDIR